VYRPNIRVVYKALSSIVAYHLLPPAIPADNLVDQYAFKPTGSTILQLWYTSPIK